VIIVRTKERNGNQFVVFVFAIVTSEGEENSKGNVWVRGIKILNDAQQSINDGKDELDAGNEFRVGHDFAFGKEISENSAAQIASSIERTKHQQYIRTPIFNFSVRIVAFPHLFNKN
jgi:hypothetical protein